MSTAGWYTVAAALIAAIVGPFIAVLTTRVSLRRQSRVDAENTEVTVRAKFVQDLTARVSDLEGRLDRASKRERDLVDRYRQDIESVDRRWRHLTNNLLAYSQVIVAKLRASGIDVPPFTGWDRFVEEGGTVRREWLDDSSD